MINAGTAYLIKDVTLSDAHKIPNFLRGVGGGGGGCEEMCKIIIHVMW